MRTTITLEPEAEELIRRLMRDRDLTFKQAVNFAIKAGLSPRHRLEPFETPTVDLGRALVPLDRALALAGQLEDEELLRKMDLGK